LLPPRFVGGEMFRGFSAARAAARSRRSVGTMGHPGAFSAASAVAGSASASSSSEHELRVLGRHVAVTCTNDADEIAAWLQAHIFARADAAAGDGGSLLPLGLDCEFQPRFVRGAAAPPLACLQLATENAVLVAQVLGLAAPARGGGGAAADRPLPRALSRLFASPAQRRLVLPVGVGVREDVTKLLDALGLGGGARPPAAAATPAAPVGVRELAAAELLACLAGGGDDGDGDGNGGGGLDARAAPPPPHLQRQLRLSPLPPSASVACVNLAELNSWLGFGRGAGHSAGLEALARQLLGFPRWKRRSITMSAWESWPLDRGQQKYAALDAFASLRVFSFLLRALQRSGGARPVPRPRLYAPQPSDDAGAS
jgi:hypothetical protein